MGRKRNQSRNQTRLAKLRRATSYTALAFVLSASGCSSNANSRTADSTNAESLSERSVEATQQPTKPGVEIGSPLAPATGGRIVLSDVTAASGIDFVHHFDGGDNRYIVETIASGIATLDYDNDGMPDIYFLNGTHLPEPDAGDSPNQLYRNSGEFQFQNVTPTSRAFQVRHSLGVCVGDYDNDGFSDIFVNNFGQNTLLHNLGDGTFEDVTNASVLGVAQECGAGACFFDANNDGALDLYVGNYVQDPIASNVQRTTDGFPSIPGPLDFQPASDQLLLSRSDGTFIDVSKQSGIEDLATTSMGLLATDFDQDGDTDIMVVNDVERNVLLENTGQGRFQDVGILQGVAFSYDASRNGNMGIDAADHNNDGSVDFFTTTFSNDLPVLYENSGFGMFTDKTLASQAGVSLLPHANWGVAFVDVDNNLHQDIFIANGHTDRNVGKWAHNTAWKVANSLFYNGGESRYTDVSDESGSGLEPVESSRGVAVEDFDGDGREDIVVLNALAAPTLIKNETPHAGNWLRLRLIGMASNRDAAGARVVVKAGETAQMKEVYCGRSYQSSFGQQLHFGLGKSEIANAIEVNWPSGRTSHLAGVKVNQQVDIFEDR